MKNFFKYIKESLNSKNYRWIKSDFSFRKVAYFKTKEGKEIFLNIDEINNSVFNVHFYYFKDNKKIIELTNEGEEFQIFGNIKNAIDDFINTHYVDFIGYSANEKERNDLYVMYLKQVSQQNFKCYWKTTKNITYYFIVNKDLPHMIMDKYEKDFVKYDGKNKKYPYENNYL